MRNQPSTHFAYWLVLGLALLGLACNSLPGLDWETSVAIPTPVDLTKPHSSIQPLQAANVTDLGDRVSVGVGTELFLRSHHLSTEPLETLDIRVNNQPANEFPAELGQLEVVSGDEFLVADKIKPALIRSEYPVLLRWIGRVPGTYEVKIQATDKAGHTGEPVSYRIEVR